MSPFRFGFKAMGGRCEILICAETEASARQAAEAAMNEVLRIEHTYSRYRPDSLVSRVNLAAGSNTWTECTPEATWLLDYADRVFRESDGAFDITTGVLRKAWNFTTGEIPSEARLQPLLALIGWARVERDGNRVRLPQAGMEIDFGGFGKEYAADCAAHVLANQGIRHGYVNLGGDISVLGPQPDETPWLIAIQDPRQPDAIVATIPMHRGGLATSGDYEKYFEHAGQRYCHILDPRTGWPVKTWRSVSVQAPLTLVAGSYSTVTMLKGLSGLDWLKQSGFSYLALDTSGQIFQSTH